MLWVGFVLGQFSLVLNKNKVNPVQLKIFVPSPGALDVNEGPKNVCLKCKKCERSKSQLYLPLNSALVTYSRTIFYRKSFPQLISWFDSSLLIGWTLPWVKLFRRFPGSVVSVAVKIAWKVPCDVIRRLPIAGWSVAFCAALKCSKALNAEWHHFSARPRPPANSLVTTTSALFMSPID